MTLRTELQRRQHSVPELPPGGKTILAARMQGKRPAGSVVVTDSPRVVRNARNRGMAAILVRWDGNYDLRILHALDITMLVAIERDRQKTVPVAQQILEAQPRSFLARYWATDESEWVVAIPAAQVVEQQPERPMEMAA